MNFSSDFVQTEAPELVDLGFLAINVFNESGVFSTPATRIRRPTDVSHWSTPDHGLGEATAVEMSAPKSYHDYSYKTRF